VEYETMSDTAAVTAPHASFFDEQIRRRREAWRLGLVCLALAAAVGAVLSTIIGPLLLLLAAGSLRLLAAAGLAPARSWLQAIEAWVQAGISAGEHAMDLIGRVQGVADALAVAPAIGRAALLLLPGMVAGMLLWTALARFHRRHAAAAACATLGAREPRPADHEERQLGNIVAEMALAAGLPAPRLMLIDAAQANAAAFGASHLDATVVVTRGLLDRLDRQETVGAVAHVVASAGNGDLRLAAAVLAVFQTLGAFLTLFDLPFRRGAWMTLGGLAGACMRRVTDVEAVAIGDGLTSSLTPASSEAMLKVMSLVERWPPLGALMLAPLVPWMLLTVLQKFIVQMWMLFLFGWPLAWLWRTRRFLADAVAVQLTRDPDALAEALRHIDAEVELPPGASALELGFFHAPSRRQSGLRERLMVVSGFTPDIGTRLARLVAQGASGRGGMSFLQKLAGLRKLPLLQRALVGVFTVILLPLFITLVVMVGLLLLGATALSAAAGLALASLMLRL
jgi:Zn-dependent protease with chaperone function